MEYIFMNTRNFSDLLATSNTYSNVTLTFLNCWKWKFHLNELYYNKSNRSLTLRLTNQEFEYGDYYISLQEESVFLCIPVYLYPQFSYFDAVFVFLLSLSVTCLFIAFYQHFTSSRKLKYNHDCKPMLCHITCLCIIFIITIVYQTSFSNRISTEWKILHSVFDIIFYFSTITWLNIVSFNIWKQFHPKNVMIQIQHTTKRFIYCCFYAFGLPILIALVVIVPRILISSPNSVYVNPAFISKDWLVQVFVIGGSITLNIINLVFYVLTLINLRKARKTIKNVTTFKCEDKSILGIGMNLFVVSGLIIISGLVGHMLRKINNLLPLLPDAIAALQGVYLFIIYCYRSASPNCCFQR